MEITRNFKHLIMAVILSFLALPAISFAGGNTDFSGTWIINEAKSDAAEGRSMRSPELVVTQDGNNLTIERSFKTRDGEIRKRSQTVTLDGKEITDESERRTIIASTSWSEDGSLSIKSLMKFSRQGETMEVNTSETWTLDKGGKTLTIDYAVSSSRGDRSATLVYDLK